MGLKLAGRAGPGLGQTFTDWVGPGPGLGLNSSLQAWAGPGLKNCCGPGPGLGRACTLTANCGPGLGSNYKPAHGTSMNTHERLFTRLNIFPISHFHLKLSTVPLFCFSCKYLNKCWSEWLISNLQILIYTYLHAQIQR